MKELNEMMMSLQAFIYVSCTQEGHAKTKAKVVPQLLHFGMVVRLYHAL